MSEYNRTLYVLFKWSHKQWKYVGTFYNLDDVAYYKKLHDPHAVYDLEVRESED